MYSFIYLIYNKARKLTKKIKEFQTHKASMAVYKNATFQQVRRRRNAMINEMINKCFPWSRLEAIENKTVVGVC